MDSSKLNGFILGLCRSRTAWLANFLTYNGHFCYHEGLNNCYSINEYVKKIDTGMDSGTALMLIDLDRYFPFNKKIIIERDINEILPWVTANFDKDEKDYLFFQKECLDKIEGLRIPYNKINDNLKEIWQYMADDEFDEKRANFLIKLNVQVHDIYDVNIDAAKNLFKMGE